MCYQKLTFIVILMILTFLNGYTISQTAEMQNFDKSVDTNFADVIDELIVFMNAPLESGESGQYMGERNKDKNSEPDYDKKDEEEYFQKLGEVIKGN